jgi:hypothetical protein
MASVAKSASTGAAIGSMVPGIGTGVGAAVGGAFGAIKNADFGSILGTSREDKRRRRDQARTYLESAGLKPGSIKDWHSDKFPRFEMYVRMAKVYGFPVIEAINTLGDPSHLQIENYLKQRGIISPALRDQVRDVAFNEQTAAQNEQSRGQVAAFQNSQSIMFILAAGIIGYFITRK